MKIRKAVLSDARGIAKVHVDSWRTTYKGIVSDSYLDSLSYEGREELWNKNLPNGLVYVAENEKGDIVGFSSGGKERSGNYPAYKGELNAIYLLKEYQRNGLGKLLVKPIVEELLEQDIESMLVLVLKENKSKYFYENLGAKEIGELEDETAGKPVTELVYGWEDIKTLLSK